MPFQGDSLSLGKAGDLKQSGLDSHEHKQEASRIRRQCIMPEPIGSIIAYGGEIAPRPPGTDVGVWENNNGWLLCDGRLLSANPTGGFWDLFGAIGFAWGAAKDRQHFNIPNLQGYFLRGVDLSRDQHIDQDRDSRFARHTGGNEGAKVGSFQWYATARPVPGPFDKPDTSFRTNAAGLHTHNLFSNLTLRAT
jgi:hypothetical protein